MIAYKKNFGFVTTIILFIICGTLLVSSSKFKVEHKELHNFYGQHVSHAQEKELLAKNTFYFRFNSYEVEDQDKLALFAHARKLLNQPKLSVCINGHTDNKGSAKYNLKLGMLRAKAIAEVLASKGVNLDRMIIISYANLVPIVTKGETNTENLDRRVELIYQYKEDPSIK